MPLPPEDPPDTPMSPPRPISPDESGTSRPVLLAVAAEVELRAIVDGLGVRALAGAERWRANPLCPGVEVVLTGIGKANAAGGVAGALDRGHHGGVISLGIGGSLPGGAEIGSLVLGERSVFADEGIETETGFQSCLEMGFPIMPGESDVIEACPSWVEAWAGQVDLVAPIATVSTCSGTDERARRVGERTGAAVEAMEGAGVGLAAHTIAPGLPFAELRVVSNTTGNRASQRWELERALSELGRVLGRLSLARSPD